MFVYAEWERFCSTIEPSSCFRADRADVIGNHVTQFTIIKHDVETKPRRALALAEIEARHGIEGTYYVQADLMTKRNEPVFRQILDLGHEVAYHYDVLDGNHGDWERAEQEFATNLRTFEELGFPVKTVCPHGNPIVIREGWTSNKDFFRDPRTSRLYPDVVDIVVNFRPLAGRAYSYVSDTGYGWRIVGDVANNDRVSVPDERLDGLSDILTMIANGASVVVSTHPHRWEKHAFRATSRRAAFTVVKKSASVLCRLPMARTLLSRFYHHARRI